MPRKKTTNSYFNSDVEDAIHAFNVCTDERERNDLFKTIYPALQKMAQVWRNKIKPTYVELPDDELEMDCVTFMLEKLPMIKAGKGKAFSYLTVTARNYYILANQQAYSKKKKKYSLEAMPDSFDIAEVVSNRPEEMELNSEIFESFIEYIQDNFESMFSAKQQKEFASVLMDKIKKDGFSEEFNRRKFLNNIASETGIPRGLVTKHVNRVASFYSAFKDYYEKYGVKPQFKEKLHISKEDEEYIRKNYQHYSKHNGLSGISRQLGINYDVLRNWVKATL